MRPRVLFLAGLVLGTLLGLAFLLAPVTLIPGLVVWAWLIGRRPRYLGASGALVGFGGLRSIEDSQALLETIAVETLALENSIARNRALTAIVTTGAKLIELGDLASRVAAIEAALGQRHREEVAVFPAGEVA